MSIPPYPPQEPYPPPGYPGYGYGYPARDHPQGIIVLVLGILGVTACQILGPVAWVMGNNAMREIDMNPTAYANRGMVQAGRICGIVGTVLLILTVLWLVVLILLGAAGAFGTR